MHTNEVNTTCIFEMSVILAILCGYPDFTWLSLESSHLTKLCTCTGGTHTKEIMQL